MSFSAVLDVALGLSFVYFVLSLLCSALNELLAAAFAFRAATLAQGVCHLLNGKSEADRFYAHPLIQALHRPRRKPSYVPPERFALVVTDLYTPELLRGEQPTFASAPAGRVRDSLELLWLEAGKEQATFRRNLETWFDDTMERVSGWYRRRTQIILGALAVIFAVGLNVNTVGVTQRLWTDPPLRAALAQAAATTQESRPEATRLQEAAEQYRRVDAVRLPLGWSDGARPSTWWVGLLGWALTALAVSLGAPFWFDVLRQAARLRSSGEKPEESKED